MPGIGIRRRLYLLGAVLASQFLTACVIVPVPYHHRHYVVSEPYQGEVRPAPRDYRDYRGRH